MKLPLLAAAAAIPAAITAAIWAAVAPASAAQDPAVDDALVQLLGEQGIQLDLAAGVCAIDAQVEVRDDLLEYLLVLPHGAAHESLFVAGAGRAPEELDVWAQAFNAALLTLGVAPGKNAEWVQKDPPPSPEELREGASAYDIVLPEGDGLFMYAAWREGDEVFFYRAEDLVRDLERRRTMRRHAWVYLGSRMITRTGSGDEAFAAALEGNLINVSFFAAGNTLLTGALEECLNQTTWLPNAWLLPERGGQVLLLFSRQRLDQVPAECELPQHPPSTGGPR